MLPSLLSNRKTPQNTAEKKTTLLSNVFRNFLLRITGHVINRRENRLIENQKTKALLGFGWFLFGVGIVVLLIYGIISFLSDPSEALWARVGLACIGLGLAVLFVYVTYQRVVSRKSDPYRDVNN